MHVLKPQEKAIQELGEHVRKALKPIECAPKQKHVRSCIVFSWDYGTSLPIWQSIKLHPVLSDHVICLKALITLHKLLIAGPHVVLSESLKERPFLESCERIQGGHNLGSGYGPLIKAHVQYILAKLEFHRQYPQFSGNFDYEEYLSLKGISDLNEGYMTIMDLLNLEAKLLMFPKIIFNNGSVNVIMAQGNECKIAALIPMIEESYGMYKFMTSMLTAMHLCVDSPDALEPLVQKYNEQYVALKKFYDDSRQLRYLISLVSIPVLPDRSPEFLLDDGTEADKNRANKFFQQSSNDNDQNSKRKVDAERGKKSPPSSAVAIVEQSQEGKKVISTMNLLDDIITTNSSCSNINNNSNTASFTSQTITVPDRQLEYSYHASQQEIQRLQSIIASEHQGMEKFRALEACHQHDHQMLEIYHNNILELKNQNEINSKELLFLKQENSNNIEEESSKIGNIEAKYEAMSNLYQNFRREHLNLLEELKKSKLENNILSQDLVEIQFEMEQLKISSNNNPFENDHDDQSFSSVMTSPVHYGSLEDELKRAAQIIQDASHKLSQHQSDSKVAQDTIQMTIAINNLIKYAIKCQKEIQAQNDLHDPNDIEFYKKNSIWTKGLISAAQTVATGTIILVNTSQSLINKDGTKSLEQVIVSSNSVTAATMQLVTASRVRESPSQSLLEGAAKQVSDANKKITSLSKSSSKSPNSNEDNEEVDDLLFTDCIDNVPKPNTNAYMVIEMEQQVKILSLEQELTLARRHLSFLRKQSYKETESNETIQEKMEKKIKDGKKEISPQISTTSSSHLSLPSSKSWSEPEI